jgi:hypothetical protein
MSILNFLAASACGEFFFSASDLLRVFYRRNRVDRSSNINKPPRRSPKPPENRNLTKTLSDSETSADTQAQNSMNSAPISALLRLCIK